VHPFLVSEAALGSYDLVRHTSYLFVLVKMAQLLVVQRAVTAADIGDVNYPADLLEDTGLSYGPRQPISKWTGRGSFARMGVRFAILRLVLVILIELGIGVAMCSYNPNWRWWTLEEYSGCMDTRRFFIRTLALEQQTSNSPNMLYQRMLICNHVHMNETKI